MVEEKISQEFRLKNIDKKRNYFLEEIEQNKLTSKKHKKVCTMLYYIEHFLILASTITGCISIFCFCFFAWYSYRNHEFCNRIKICGIAAGIKNYKSIIKKKKQ